DASRHGRLQEGRRAPVLRRVAELHGALGRGGARRHDPARACDVCGGPRCGLADAVATSRIAARGGKEGAAEDGSPDRKRDGGRDLARVFHSEYVSSTGTGSWSESGFPEASVKDSTVHDFAANVISCDERNITRSSRLGSAHFSERQAHVRPASVRSRVT